MNKVMVKTPDGTMIEIDLDEYRKNHHSLERVMLVKNLDGTYELIDLLE